MDFRGHNPSGYPADMLDMRWDLDGEEDEAAPEDIRLRGPKALKEDMEFIAELQTLAMKEFLKRRRGMSANRLWLSVAQGFRMAFVAKFGPLPQRSDVLGRKHYAERISEAMKQQRRK